MVRARFKDFDIEGIAQLGQLSATLSIQLASAVLLLSDALT